jgi:hypothetical protein
MAILACKVPAVIASRIACMFEPEPEPRIPKVSMALV